MNIQYEINKAQAGIDSCVVHIPRGVHTITEPLVIGNGDSSRESELRPIHITGEGYGGSNYGDSSLIVYDGPRADDRFLLEFHGPMKGVQVSNLRLHGNSKIGGILDLRHTAYSKFEDIYGCWFTKLAMRMDTVKDGMSYGCAYNQCSNIIFEGPANENACGLSMDGQFRQLDTCSNTFTGGLFWYGGAPGSYGVRLKGADNNRFLGTNFLAIGAADILASGRRIGPSVLMEQWQHHDAFPLENWFLGVALSTPPQGESSWGNVFLTAQSDMADSWKMPDGVSGILARDGLFGDVWPSFAHSDDNETTMDVQQTNGLINSAGGIGFLRPYYSQADYQVGAILAHWFEGFRFRFHQKDLFRINENGLFFNDRGTWKKVKLEG